MSEETRLRAFEPFFTTKPRGRARGSVCRRPTASCSSAAARSRSTARPAAERAWRSSCPQRRSRPPQRQAAARRRAPRRRRTRRAILLVEDDPSVRRLLTLMLAELGLPRARGRRAATRRSSSRTQAGGRGRPRAHRLRAARALRRRAVRRAARALARPAAPGHDRATPRSRPPARRSCREGAELLGKPFTREQLDSAPGAPARLGLSAVAFVELVDRARDRALPARATRPRRSTRSPISTTRSGPTPAGSRARARTARSSALCLVLEKLALPIVHAVAEARRPGHARARRRARAAAARRASS